MSNHVGPQNIRQGIGSVAFSSYTIPKKLVIFVHGFNGHAINTWDEFPQLIRDQENFREADVIFYGYDSLKTQANNMTLRLFDLINTAVDPSKMPYATLRDLPQEFLYEKIIIIAHSLGAVVTRLALLHAKASQSTWVNKCHLLFFAPAHFGSHIPENFRECFLGFSVLFRSFAVTKYPIIKDLSVGSVILTQLETRTKTLIETENPDYMKARIVWASNDIVVLNNPYCSDFPAIEIDDTSHTSVCKPTGEKLHAFNHVLNIV